MTSYNGVTFLDPIKRGLKVSTDGVAYAALAVTFLDPIKRGLKGGLVGCASRVVLW